MSRMRCASRANAHGAKGFGAFRAFTDEELFLFPFGSSPFFSIGLKLSHFPFPLSSYFLSKSLIDSSKSSFI